MVNRLFTRRHGKKTVKNENDDQHQFVEQKSQCQECQQPNSRASYRPLVNDDGAFLCDSCYRGLFPATAMFDMNNQTFFSKINQRIRDNRDGIGYPEEEECHACLEHGKYRRCCKKYYCRSCYYELGFCPGCNVACHRSGVSQQKQTPSKMDILAVWGISLGVILVVVSIVSVTIVNHFTKPFTVWGHTCNGWFPKCTKPVCIDLGTNSPTSGMPTQYDFCNVNETSNKIVGDACIFDPELYRWSGRMMGFDICIDGARNNTSNARQRQGVYVFEDNFDYWKNSTNYTLESVMMKSAKWAKMENAEATNICGVNNLTRPYELDHGDYASSRKNASLVFSGVNLRFAQTTDLDVRYGGKVEFYLKLAPVVENELVTECKTAFVGDVSLAYSIDEGASWQSMKTYPVWKYRSRNFAFLDEEIPKEAETNSTRFRWGQSVFDPQRDYWAIDDVRIFSYFNPSFYESNLYQAKDKERKDNVHFQQCRFDTEQCNEIPNEENGNEHFRLRIVHIYITACSFILVCRKFFWDLHGWMHAPTNFESKLNGDMRKPSIPLKREFKFQISKIWQIFAVAVLSLPLLLITAFMGWHITRWWPFYSDETLCSAYIALSYVMDFWTVRRLAIDVIHYWPCQINDKVEIDATEETEMLIVGSEEMPLLNISDVGLFSKGYNWALFASVCISGLPLTNAIVFIKAVRMKHESYVILLHVFGVSSLCRSLLGPMWFVEIFLAFRFICSLSDSKRDDMGRSFSRPSVGYTTANSTVLSLLVGAPILCFNFWDALNTTASIIVILATTFFGALVGTMIGVLRGLPIVPKIHLTTWPNDGYHFTLDRKSQPSYVLSKILSGGMNSFEYHVMNIDEMEIFRLFLEGNANLNDVLGQSSENSEGMIINSE